MSSPRGGGFAPRLARIAAPEHRASSILAPRRRFRSKARAHHRSFVIAPRGRFRTEARERHSSNILTPRRRFRSVNLAYQRSRESSLDSCLHGETFPYRISRAPQAERYHAQGAFASHNSRVP